MATPLEPRVDTAVATLNPIHVHDPVPGNSPSQSAASGSGVQERKSESIAESFNTSAITTQDSGPAKPVVWELSDRSPTHIKVQTLNPQQNTESEEVTISVPAATEDLAQSQAPPAKEPLATILPEAIEAQTTPPVAPVVPDQVPALVPEEPTPPPLALEQVPASVPRALNTPPATPTRKAASPLPPLTPTPTPTALAPLPEEGDTFKDFREPPKSVSTPPATPSPSPSTSKPAFGRLSFGSSFSSLVQAVTSATAGANMGLTGDGRPKAANQNGGFGGWLQKRASAQSMVGVEVAPMRAEEDTGSYTPNRTRSASNVSKLTIGRDMGDGVNGVFMPSGTTMRSSASSFVEGSSRPSTPKNGSSSGSTVLSPARMPMSPLKSIPEPPNPALIDEFQGLSFPMLISSFRAPPPARNSTHSNMSERPSTEDRLEELANMAQDLLERMYTAYTKRTAALGEVLAEQSVLREEIEERKVKARHLQSQLDRMSQDAEKAKEEKDEVINILVKELETEKVKMEEERREWQDEREQWRNVEREKIRAELLMEMLAAQGTVVVGEDADADADADLTPKKKRVSTGGASSDSGFDESDKSDADSFYSMAKQGGESTDQAATSARVTRNPSMASTSSPSTPTPTPTPTPTREEKEGEKTQQRERGGKMVPAPPPLPLLNPTPLSVVRCETCARMSFTNHSSGSSSSRPSSPSPSVTSFSSPPAGGRYPPRAHEGAVTMTTTTSTTTTAATTAPRWGFGVLKAGTGTGAGAGMGAAGQTQQELDRLRGENRGLRERVGDLEKGVDGALGVLGGWRR